MTWTHTLPHQMVIGQARLKATWRRRASAFTFRSVWCWKRTVPRRCVGAVENRKLSGQVTFRKMAAHPRTLAAIVRKVPEAEGSSFALGGGDHRFTSPGPDLRGSPPCTCTPLLSVVSYALPTALASCIL